jgi:hypothetical protein
VIGPRRDIVDHHGDWARAREVGEGGCVLVRPDQHVAWRAEDLARTRKRNSPGCFQRSSVTATAMRHGRQHNREHGMDTHEQASSRKRTLQRWCGRNAKAENARLAEVMAVITKHLHAAVKEIEPTQEEWFEAIMFLTKTGQMSATTGGRSTSLLSDVTGRIDVGRRDQQPQTDRVHRNPRCSARSMLEDAPELPMGANICLDQKGRSDAG